MRKRMLGFGLIIGCIGASLLSYVWPNCFGGEMSIVQAFTDNENTLEYDNQGNIRVFSYNNYYMYNLAKGVEGYTIADIEQMVNPYLYGYHVQEYKSSIVTDINLLFKAPWKILIICNSTAQYMFYRLQHLISPMQEPERIWN